MLLLLFKGWELLIERCLALGERIVGGETASITTLPAKLLLVEEDELLRKRRELLIWDKGTELDDDEVFTVFTTLVSDKESSFFTASGECAPFFQIKNKNQSYKLN